MIRTIDGFHLDDAGDWVAELSCLHGQHVRHRPPFRDRAWVETEDGARLKAVQQIELLAGGVGRMGAKVETPGHQGLPG